MLCRTTARGYGVDAALKGDDRQLCPDPAEGVGKMGVQATPCRTMARN